MFEALLPFEIEVFHWVASWANPFWDRFFVIITTLGDHGILWIALGLLLLINKRTRKAGLVVLLAMGLMALINNITLKSLFARPRPFLLELDWWVESFIYPELIKRPGGLAFPSGHSAGAFAGAAAWLLGSRQWAKRAQYYTIIAIILAGGIAFSRLYVGVHYLSDIIAGPLVGVGCAFLAYFAIRKLEPQLDRLSYFRWHGNKNDKE